MSYRDVSESLRSYRNRVAGELEEARQAAREAAERADKVRILEKELAETDGLLAKVTGPKNLPLLENVAIAAPCKADWDQMVGDDRVRFCRQCEKNVYNLSALPREEAEALLAAREGKMCVRLYKREDGTVLTSDCPVGAKRRRRRRAVAGVLGGGLLAATAAMAATSTTRVTMGSPPPTTVMGAAPVMTGIPAVTGSAVVVDPPAPTVEAVQGKVHVLQGTMPAVRPLQGKPGRAPGEGAAPKAPTTIMGDLAY
jgi:hypothetical protein